MSAIVSLEHCFHRQSRNRWSIDEGGASIRAAVRSLRVPIYAGTAGWSIPPGVVEFFARDGTTLERYAATLPAAEINSSFHRPHRLSTWERWGDSVPDEFRFSVKVPKQITHIMKLVDCDNELDLFIAQAAVLGDKLGVLLVQLPPKLSFDPVVAWEFFAKIAMRTSAAVACEPRHTSWFTDDADHLLRVLGVARVAADPAICEAAACPGGSPVLRYWRLHGSPVIYRSPYLARVEGYAAELAHEAAQGRDAWCIFDNTASSAAATDALALLGALNRRENRATGIG